MFNPFKQLGDINQMRKQAMELQKALDAEIFDIVEGNVQIKINGNQSVLEVLVDGVPNEQLKRAMNNAVKRSQQAAAGKLSELTKNMPQ